MRRRATGSHGPSPPTSGPRRSPRGRPSKLADARPHAEQRGAPLAITGSTISAPGQADAARQGRACTSRPMPPAPTRARAAPRKAGTRMRTAWRCRRPASGPRPWHGRCPRAHEAGVPRGLCRVGPERVVAAWLGRTSPWPSRSGATTVCSARRGAARTVVPTALAFAGDPVDTAARRALRWPATRVDDDAGGRWRVISSWRGRQVSHGGRLLLRLRLGGFWRL